MATEYRPIPRLAVGVYPLTNVTPFTYRDGVTYERLLHQLIDRMNTIIGEVNANNQALFDVVIENMNITIDAVNAALGEQTDEVDQKLADLTEYVDVEVAKIVDMRAEMIDYRDETEAFRNQAETFSATTVELQDTAVAALIDTPGSETQTQLNAAFADKDTQTIVESGRLSETQLNDTIAEEFQESNRYGAGTGDAQVNALINLELQRFNSFRAWCRLNNARAFVGEIGWPSLPDYYNAPADPGGERWADVGEVMYRALDRVKMDVCYWAAHKIGHDGPFIYDASGGVSGTLDTKRPQAVVVERHNGVDARRGINFTGHNGFSERSNPGTGSNLNPGTFGTTYTYGTLADYQYLAAQGYDTVRLTTRWERFQPGLNLPLNPTEIARLNTALGYIEQAGMQAIICLKNTGLYYADEGGVSVPRAIGDVNLTIGNFADVWQRLSVELKDNTAVLGYDLMNEPTEVTTANWHAASQAAVTAIRSTGDTKLILVEGAYLSSVEDWVQRNGATGWIVDPGGNFAYSPHWYPGALYTRSFDGYGEQAAFVVRETVKAGPRHGANAGEISTTTPSGLTSARTESGRTYITYFTAPYDLTVTELVSWVGNHAGANLTSGRMSLALASMFAPWDHLTIVAETANDPDMWSATFGRATAPLDTGRGGPSAYRLVAGQRYALLQHATAPNPNTDMPSLAKHALVASAMGATGAPRMGARIDGQTGIPAPGSVITTAEMSPPSDLLYMQAVGTPDGWNY